MGQASSSKRVKNLKRLATTPSASVAGFVRQWPLPYLEKRIAKTRDLPPRISGVDEDDEILSTFRGTGGEGRKASECPICFQVRPIRCAVTSCCQSEICTECFLQVVDPRSRTNACPFCTKSGVMVALHPPLSDAEADVAIAFDAAVTARRRGDSSKPSASLTADSTLADLERDGVVVATADDRRLEEDRIRASRDQQRVDRADRDLQEAIAASTREAAAGESEIPTAAMGRSDPGAATGGASTSAPSSASAGEDADLREAVAQSLRDDTAPGGLGRGTEGGSDGAEDAMLQAAIEASMANPS